MPDQPYTSDLRKRLALRINEFVPPRQIFAEPRPRQLPELARITTPLRFPGPNRAAQEWERSQAREQGSQASESATDSSQGRSSSPPPGAVVIDLTMSSDEEVDTTPEAPASSPADKPKPATTFHGGTKRSALKSPDMPRARGRKVGRGTRVVRFADEVDESPQPPGQRGRKPGVLARVVRFSDELERPPNSPPPAPVRPSRGGGPRGMVGRRGTSMRGRQRHSATLRLPETPVLSKSLDIEDSDEYNDSDDDSLYSYFGGKTPRLAPVAVRGSRGSRGRRATTRGRAKTLIPTSTRYRKKQGTQELRGADNDELDEHPVLKPGSSSPMTKILVPTMQQSIDAEHAAPIPGEGYISPIRALDAIVTLARAQAHNSIDKETYTEQQKALISLRDARKRRTEEFNRLTKQQAKDRLEQRGGRAIDGSPAGRSRLIWVNGRPYMRSLSPVWKDSKESGQQ
ncbi:hypothetical protein DFP73DRAFT_592036 [Morchella snyderi]|nr:hypothetical protein DFP73DRAFT_592036 [Morchella snyderi]